MAPKKRKPTTKIRSRSKEIEAPSFADVKAAAVAVPAHQRFLAGKFRRRPGNIYPKVTTK
jgi:hypothetical protein